MAHTASRLSTVTESAREITQAALYVPTKPFLDASLGVELPSSLRLLGHSAYTAATLPAALAAAAMLRGIKL